MAIADRDAHLELKKRARRRLVGATALALLAAIILPMVMDQEPKPVSREIQVRIPSRDAPFDGRPQPPVEQASQTRVESPDSPPPAAEAAPARKDAKPVPKDSLDGKPLPAGKDERKQPKTDKTTPSKPAAPLAKSPEEPAVPEEKAPPKKPAPKPAEKSAAAKPAEKPAQKPADKPPAKSAEVSSPKTEKSLAGEGKSDEARAKAILGDGEDAAPPPARFVLQLGAFADAEKARKVQARVKSEGYNSYTQSTGASAGAKVRVRAGPFSSREAAEKAREKLKQLGIDGIVAPKP
ncbi:MAG: SPOR domain-containing protein [Rhodocyclaceae bacterium]